VIRFFAIAVLLFANGAGAMAGQETAFVGATVIIRADAPPIANATILIEDGRIAAVGHASEIPLRSDTMVLDMTGKWIIPGLIDAHVHFFQSGGLYTRPDVIDLRAVRPYAVELARIRARLPQTFARYLASGVTGVVDVGGPFWNFEVRDLARRAAVAPRVAVAGPLLATIAPKQLASDDPAIVRIDSPDAARAEVRRQAARKPDLVKIWFIRTRDENLIAELAWIRAAIVEAHALGLRVAVHATELETARLAVEAGADVLVHSIESAPVDDAFLALLRARGVIYITTLGVYEGYWEVLGQHVRLTDIDARVGDPDVIASFAELADLPDDVKPAWLKPRPPPPISRIVLDNLKRVQAAGVVVAAGTDAGNIGTLHGPALHREFELMAEAGLTPAQILAATTTGAARAMGRDDIGAIEPGMRADMVILDADPLADMRNARRIHRVVKDGVIYDPETILSDLRR